MVAQEQTLPQLIQLSAEFARQHINELVSLAGEISEVNTTAEELLTERKPDGRICHAKWLHSFALVEANEVIGFSIAYERDAEANDNYPCNTLYINDLAVRTDKQRHGYGRQLMKAVLWSGLEHGFVELEGPLVFSLQTNSADWNKPIQQFYETFGFQVVGYKEYPQEKRRDVVMHADAGTVRQFLGAENENHGH